MALVDDDQVEPGWLVLDEQFAVIECLVGREVDPGLRRCATEHSDRILLTEDRSEFSDHGVIDENIAVGEVEHPRPWIWSVPSSRPVRRPERMDQLRGEKRLSGTGGQDGQHSLLSGRDRLEHPLDGDVLVVAWLLHVQTSQYIAAIGNLEEANAESVELTNASIVVPQLLRGFEPRNLMLRAGGQVDLDDLVTVGGVDMGRSSRFPYSLACWTPVRSSAPPHRTTGRRRGHHEECDRTNYLAREFVKVGWPHRVRAGLSGPTLNDSCVTKFRVL